MAILVSLPVVGRLSSRTDSDPVDVVLVARLDSRLDAEPVVSFTADSGAEAYRPRPWCAYRRVLIRRSGQVLEVIRWAQNCTSWVSLSGVLDGSTSRAVVRVLRSEDRSVSVVVNASEMTLTDPSCLADLTAVFTAVRERGAIVDQIEAPLELSFALAEVTRSDTARSSQLL